MDATEPSTPFARPDLVPLWDRPPSFLPLRPPASFHHWRLAEVRRELERVGTTLDPGLAERRVALLAHPDLTDGAATDGLHVGLQRLGPSERAADPRHTPSALRIGLVGRATTQVDVERVPLGPRDVVLNPSGTWHGHEDHTGDGALWLDVVDLPLTGALGGVLFEPGRAHRTGDLLDPPTVPPVVAYPWADQEPRLRAQDPIDGVRTLAYGDGQVLPTLAVTVHAIEPGATLERARQTGGSVVLVGEGTLAGQVEPGTADARELTLAPDDVVALRAWTGLRLTASPSAGALVFVVDISPALRALGLHRREQPS